MSDARSQLKEDKQPRRIAPNEVWLAATRLKKAGIAPTPNAVRKALGDRGSFTTIQEHLAAWHERQARTEAIFENLPAASAEALADMLWELIAHGGDVADSVAQHQLSGLQEAFDQQAQQLDGVSRALDIEREEHARARAMLLSKEAESRSTLEALSSERERTIADLEKSRRTIETVQSQLAAKEDENKRLAQAAAEKDDYIAALTARYEKLLAVQETTTSKTQDLERLCAQQNSSIAHMEEKAGAASAQIKELTDQLHSLQQAEKIAARDLATAEARAARADGQLTACLDQLEKTEAELERTRKEADERVLEVALGSSKEQRELLRQMVGKLDDSSRTDPPAAAEEGGKDKASS